MRDAVNTAESPLRPDYIQLPEKEIIARCQAGDLEAFNILISRYENRVLNLTVRYLRHYHLASDEAQEIFIKIFQKIKLFKGESAFSTWLYRVTVNHCLTVLEQKKKMNARQCSLDAMGEGGAGASSRQLEDPGAVPPDQAFDQVQLSRAMARALDRLPADQRQVIILRHYEGMSYEEMAEILQVPASTISSCLHRARQHLKKLLVKGGERI